MPFDYEKFVPREKAIIFDDRLAASSSTVFQIVHEFFEPHFLMHQIEFGDDLCWMGFHTTRTGDENRGWVRIESGLGVKSPYEQSFHLLNIPLIEVGGVSIRSLSPVASRVLIRTNHTPEALSFLFHGLAKYLVWVVNGEDAREAWSRAVTREYIKTVPQIDAGAVSLQQVPPEASDQTQNVERPLIVQTAVQKPKQKAKLRTTRKRRRGTKASSNQRVRQKIFAPANPSIFERYRKMWRVVRRTQNAYLHSANYHEETRPNPTYDELRAAIAERLGFKPSEKTVRRVIQAGTAGLLKKK